jgi:hypothetical protein
VCQLHVGAYHQLPLGQSMQGWLRPVPATAVAYFPAGQAQFPVTCRCERAAGATVLVSDGLDHTVKTAIGFGDQLRSC